MIDAALAWLYFATFGNMSIDLRIALRTAWLLAWQAIALLAVIAGLALLLLPRRLVAETWARAIAYSSTGSNTLNLALTPFDRRSSGLDGTFTGTRLKISISIQVDSPRRVAVGDSVPVKALVALSGATLTYVRGNAFATAPAASTVAPQDQARESGEQALRQLQLRLELAGAEVKPEGKTLQIDQAVIWSVRPKAAGKLTGVITPVVSPTATNSLVEVGSVEGDRSFSFEAFDNPFATTNALSWIPKIFGSLLTIPGIIAFSREYRDRKNASQRDEINRPRIVLR